MESLLQGIPGTCVYIDDNSGNGKIRARCHLDNLELTLQRLQEAGVHLKKGKCAFLLPSVKYLGVPRVCTPEYPTAISRSAPKYELSRRNSSQPVLE